MTWIYYYYYFFFWVLEIIWANRKKKSTIFSKGTISSLVHKFLCVCVCVFLFPFGHLFLQFTVGLWWSCEKTETTQLYYLGYHMTISANSVVKRKNKYLYFFVAWRSFWEQRCGDVGGWEEDWPVNTHYIDKSLKKKKKKKASVLQTTHAEIQSHNNVITQ